MHHSLKAAPALAAIAICLAGGTSAQAAVLVEENTVGPIVITDLPCLEGKEFTLTGTELIRTHFVERANGFHFNVRERHEGTAVPLDGEGPTYVERGNADHAAFNLSEPSGVVTLTHVNNDKFFAFEDGKLVASATIRIHEVEHFVVIDSDLDGQPDEIKVDFSIDRVSCP